MRHQSQPANHKCLLATVAAVFACFAMYIAFQCDRSNDTQIRWQMAATRTQQ